MLFFDAACETANWVIREMQSADGGYYSSQDADSEGVEGKFFVWSEDEINSVLKDAAQNSNIKAETIDLFRSRFGLNLTSNFEGFWHLHGYQTEASLASRRQLDKAELHKQLHLLRQHLFNYREKRVHPATDTKILCAWNGLMIQGMASAGRLLGKPEYVESAYQAAYFLKNHCWKSEQLYASFKDGKTRFNAYIDDYAFLIYGLLELLQSRWDNELYIWTLELADRLLSDFEDTKYGGFYFTSHQHETLIQRLKNFGDDAIPAGNAIATLVLNRLGYLSGNQHYIKAAENCLKSAWSAINQAPISHCALLNALNEYLRPPNILILRTLGNDEENWSSITQQYYLPFTLVYNIPAKELLHPSLAEKKAGSTNLAYPCSGMTCRNPLNTKAELKAYLQNNSYRVME